MALSHLYQFPSTAIVDRVVSKNIIFTQSGATKRIKDLFVRDVEKIVWAWKLSPETVSLPAQSYIQEIQVFRIYVRGREINDDVLYAMDKAILSPIIFNLIFANEERYVAAFKRPNEADASKVVVGKYFFSPWLTTSNQRMTIPAAISLEGLYHELFRTLIPVSSRTGETIIDHIFRAERIDALSKEITRLRSQLNSIKQYNRRVELNQEIHRMEEELRSISLL